MSVQTEMLVVLESIDKKLAILVEREPTLPAAIEVVSSITHDPYPLLTVGLQYLGMDEDDHREELMAFFEEQGILIDPSVTAWCGAYIDACLGRAGYEQVGSLAAKDFSIIGTVIQRGEKNCLCNWRNHVSIFAGRVHKSELAKLPSQKITSLEVWEKLEADDGDVEMVLGGNQSDECNISPRHWYDNYSKFLGYRKLPEINTIANT